MSGHHHNRWPREEGYGDKPGETNEQSVPTEACARARLEEQPSASFDGLAIDRSGLFAAPQGLGLDASESIFDE